MEEMYQTISPSPLQYLCLDAICDNIKDFIEPVDEEHNETPALKYPVKKCRFKDPELILHNEISENFMAKLMEKKLLCDATMFLFNSKNTTLRNVRLRDCDVGQDGLQVLKQHKISKLEYSNLTTRSPSISDILGSLNEWTMANMTDANFSCCTAGGEYLARYSLMAKMSNMRNLNLSCTDFDQINLWTICHHLKFLEKLDISNTFVVDLRPLVQLSDRLISLSIRDLSNAESYSHTIRQLSKLRYLDVSIYRQWLEVNPDGTSMSGMPLYDVLADTHSLPELHSLDISGWGNLVSNTTITDYVAAHPKLRYLGCVLNDISFDISLRNVAPPDLVIGGLSNEEQIKVALVVYRDRSDYAQEVLWHLWQLSAHFPEPRQDMFDLILPVMAAHPKTFGVQMQSTYCLFELTLNDEQLSKKVHPQVLGRAVNLMLNAMECFPGSVKLQRRVILTLTSYPILREIKFDHFRCARLILDALCKFEDEDIDLMVPFICSVLPAREMCKLGTRPGYMRKLLAIIQNRVDSRVSDHTLRFTLEALWQLIPSTASRTVFLDQGGANLSLNVLKTFKGDSGIESEVLGVLYTIAIEKKLHHRVMLDSLMNELSVLLKSENWDVSCLAAGIVAHLASGGCEWKVTSHSRDEMLRELGDTVSQWKAPDDDNKMIDFVCLWPFFMLLRSDMDFRVQLWAVWVIHDLCTKKPKKYCSMLLKENIRVLRKLCLCSKCDPKIKKISCLILEIVMEQSAVR